MFKILQQAQALERAGERVIHFEIGDPDFDTPGNIVESACRSLRRGDTHYTSSMGLYEFRQAAADATLHSRHFRPEIEQILVTPGANIIPYLAITCLVDPGQEVVVPDPGFPSYYAAIKLCGARAVRVPLREEHGFRLQPDDVAEVITPYTRLIIINSPSNPTGAVMTPEDIDAVYRLAATHGIHLLSDEVYSRMMYGDGNRFHSPSIHDRCQQVTLVANGFSKAFAMTGWRLGVVLGPAPVIEKMGLLVQTLLSCVPPFVQRAGIAALQEDQSEVQRMMAHYRERRDLLVAGLNRLPGVRCTNSEGAIYAFPNISETGLSSEEFADFVLREARVALLPGTNFGRHGEGFVRLTYATSVKRMREGLDRMAAVLQRLRPSAD